MMMVMMMMRMRRRTWMRRDHGDRPGRGGKAFDKRLSRPLVMTGETLKT